MVSCFTSCPKRLGQARSGQASRLGKVFLIYIVVSIFACHAEDPGLIPGPRVVFAGCPFWLSSLLSFYKKKQSSKYASCASGVMPTDTFGSAIHAKTLFYSWGWHRTATLHKTAISGNAYADWWAPSAKYVGMISAVPFRAGFVSLR